MFNDNTNINLVIVFIIGCRNEVKVTFFRKQKTRVKKPCTFQWENGKCVIVENINKNCKLASGNLKYIFVAQKKKKEEE